MIELLLENETAVNLVLITVFMVGLFVHYEKKYQAVAEILGAIAFSLLFFNVLLNGIVKGF
jgi:hypothetical protein